jgi:dimethylaniline monooxygenase (N-oxide forming)
MDRTDTRVAIIGAGAAGIAAGKYMLEAGFDVTVFEAGSYVGGLWVYENDNGRSQAYKHLCIISTRKYTRFSDFDFDAQTPQFPTHWDMHRYLNAYAENFGVKQCIQFNTPVESITRGPDVGPDPTWRVRTAAGATETFDAVLVATGHLNQPNHDPELQTGFAGEYLHSREYRIANPYVGKRVCVVGTGNSGVDIASDICGVAERTVLVARSGVVINPKVVFGVPFPEITVALRNKRWIPQRVRNKIMKFLVYLAHGDTTRLGLQKPTRRQHPTSSESIVSHIEFNRVAVKPKVVNIAGRVLTFADGSSEEFDALVAATGYRVHLPFIGADLLEVSGNHVDLYKRIFIPGQPGLCFVGMLNPMSTLNRIFEEQSKLLVAYLSGRVQLPSSVDMQADIDRRNELTQEIFQQSPRHEMEEGDFGYVEELQAMYQEAETFLQAARRRLAAISRRRISAHNQPNS